MIRSMTGYGRGENLANDRKFTVEIKSVNHRYNDISIKLPRSMNPLEDKIKKVLMKDIFRGKTDVYINFETIASEDVSIKFNEALADAYFEKLNVIKERYGVTSPDMLSLIAKYPDVVTSEKVQSDEDVLWETLLPALEEARDKFVAMRTVEGEALKKDILLKNDKIAGFVNEIKGRTDLVADEYRGKLMQRITEVLGEVEIDEQRILTEVTIYADRGCIDEEVIRLESHIVQLKKILEDGGVAGRKLDFLIQEMNRESNTIASKSNDITITNITIELKSEIEKIREQVQNIE
ncbi:MAG: YicC family protein [Lachnospiraceae bacterium]|nr:YicC family protein [Lachnospiraceae bacterium]